ncbi:GIY-YIG nuclease family protein [Microbacterium terregens]|uniref:GIY-YIG nuclease family protein n=1 Tax=Microbacterium terregens TaxID=69363 RepID=A0ABV5SYK4_9MICO
MSAIEHPGFGGAADIGAPLSETPLTPRQELEALLLTDKGRLGDVFNRAGLEPEQVAADLNVSSPAFVYNQRRTIDAILDGRPVQGPVYRRQVLATLRTQQARGRGILSPEAAELLAKNRAAVEAAGADEDSVQAAEEAAAEEREAGNTLVALEGVSGVYAFSYGWYLESPLDPGRGNTLIKVGMSANVAERVRQHTRSARAHIPEPLALIRVYEAGVHGADYLEQAFHALLHAAGHDNPRRTGREVGVEWFLTNADFLDTIARTIGLRTIYSGRSEFMQS